MLRENSARADVRSSPIAGTWYPGTAAALEATVDDFLANVPPQELPGQLLGLVAPHAGYPYSGQVAAYAYRLIQGQSRDRVVVISPCHSLYAGRFLVSARHYATPLGVVPIDQEIIEQLGEHIPITRLERDREHSLEIQLPFLQRTLGDFLLVPVMLQNQSWQDCQELAVALDRVLGEERPLLVASTDLCHAHDYAQVRSTDAATLAALESGDAQGFWKTAGALYGACGFGAVTTVLLTAQRWGAERVQILHHTNSGDVTGERSGYVVGYAAAAIIGSMQEA
jgi:AmmeMemoRadiSam system protein B